MGFERYVQTCMIAQDPCQGSNTVVPTCSQDYLETKRIAFPRFYFVAPAGTDATSFMRRAFQAGGSAPT